MTKTLPVRRSAGRFDKNTLAGIRSVSTFLYAVLVIVQHRIYLVTNWGRLGGRIDLLRKMKILIGRTDVAEFPDLNIDEINVKVDTGAYTSAIHASEIEERRTDNVSVVQFKILDKSHPQHDGRVYRYRNYSRKKIKNSFGKSEERFVIKTSIVLFGKTYPISLSLSERSDLKYPVLLGRKFLNNRFIIDTTLKNLSHKAKT